MAPMILGYWDCRGLVQPIRYLLEHVGQDYEFKCYPFGDTIDNLYSSWIDQKQKIGLEFPNIPYLIDGDLRLTESLAILRYLAKPHGLVATNDKDQRVQDMYDGILGDLTAVGTMFYYPNRRQREYPDDLEEAKKQFRAWIVDPKLKNLDQWMANKQYIFGDTMHYNDFVMFERLDEYNTVFPGLLSQYLNLNKHHKLMLDQKVVKSLLDSGRSSQAFRAPMADCGLAGENHVVWDEKSRSYIKETK